MAIGGFGGKRDMGEVVDAADSVAPRLPRMRTQVAALFRAVAAGFRPKWVVHIAPEGKEVGKPRGI